MPANFDRRLGALDAVASAPDALSGHDAANFVMVDKVTTVRRANVLNRVGRLSANQLVDLERLVLVFFGLAD